MRTDQPLILKRYVVWLTSGWTAVIVAMFVLAVLHERSLTLEMARIEARSDFQRDMSYRRWNAASGSVYVETSEATPPNPYMPEGTEREVTTTTGKKLTLVNPAYMTRLVFDLAAREYEIGGHLCSLRPVRPQNQPDPWERRALEAFERGALEVTSLERMPSGEYLRLMRPMTTGKECLKCHARDGYRLGDIRGGISVAVPMAPLWKIWQRKILLDGAILSVIWAIGLCGILAGAKRLRSTMRQRDAAEQGVRDLNRNLFSLASELKAANEELESFCATVSHDLRSPLAVIGGYGQLIRQSAADGDNESSLRFADVVVQQSRRMDQLIETLLNFARLSRAEPKRQPVDLSDVAAKVASELFLETQGREADFRIEEGVRCKGDPALLRIVLQNLLANAWKYTATREQAVIEFGALSGEGEKTYFVRDNGIGFDMADSDKIYEAFRRLPGAREFQGSGVGLATVKRIVTRHGGRIWCEGEPGKGATFFFTLS